MRQLVPGFLFAALWASASVATKFGVAVADPLLLAVTRFFIAGSGMLLYAYLFQNNSRLPRGKEWKELLIFAALNTTIYLGAFVLALKQVSAGIGSLSTATNPLFIMLLSAVWLKRRLSWMEIAGLVFGIGGLLVASYPLLQTSHATIQGLVILLAGMLSVSIATVYYARIRWTLSSLVINGWQVLLGGILLLPFSLLTGGFKSSHLNSQFWYAVLWLVLPVSVIALQLWFYLVKQDTVRASAWLFLCPIFGFAYAALLLHEHITVYTFCGTALVLGGLLLAQYKRLQAKNA